MGSGLKSLNRYNFTLGNPKIRLLLGKVPDVDIFCFLNGNLVDYSCGKVLASATYEQKIKPIELKDVQELRESLAIPEFCISKDPVWFDEFSDLLPLMDDVSISQLCGSVDISVKGEVPHRAPLFSPAFVENKRKELGISPYRKQHSVEELKIIAANDERLAKRRLLNYRDYKIHSAVTSLNMSVASQAARYEISEADVLDIINKMGKEI